MIFEVIPPSSCDRPTAEKRGDGFALAAAAGRCRKKAAREPPGGRFDPAHPTTVRDVTTLDF